MKKEPHFLTKLVLILIFLLSGLGAVGFEIASIWVDVDWVNNTSWTCLVIMIVDVCIIWCVQKYYGEF